MYGLLVDDDDDVDDVKRSLLDGGSMGLGSRDRTPIVLCATGFGSHFFTRDTVMAGRRSAITSFRDAFKLLPTAYFVAA